MSPVGPLHARHNSIILGMYILFEKYPSSSIYNASFQVAGIREFQTWI